MASRFAPCAALLLTGMTLAACVPEESATIALPTGVGTATLFGCADGSVRTLHARDEQWNARITLRDVARGRFETGDFSEANVMGYRVRVVSHDGAATLSVRAAGPYFTDLGADRAIATFRTTLTACLAQGAPNR